MARWKVELIHKIPAWAEIEVEAESEHEAEEAALRDAKRATRELFDCDWDNADPLDMEINCRPELIEEMPNDR